jgi:hypothetical protein
LGGGISALYFGVFHGRLLLDGGHRPRLRGKGRADG